MNPIDRRQFIAGVMLTGSSAAANALRGTMDGHTGESAFASHDHEVLAQAETAIDFRYAPLMQQTAICLPDDPYKTVVGEAGELRYGYTIDPDLDYTGYFTRIVNFSLQGTPDEKVVRQELQSPSVPIIRTYVEKAEISYVLTAFATRNELEGRVDNVILEARPRGEKPVAAAPLVTIKSSESFKTEGKRNSVTVSSSKDGTLVMIAKSFPDAATVTQVCKIERDMLSSHLYLGHGITNRDGQSTAIFRFPMEGQDAARLESRLEDPAVLLKEAEAFWSSWSPFQDPVDWKLSGRYGEFLSASARNILQVREQRNGKLTFQVGPTQYRNLFVVDGNFILEAAHYLGYDKEAKEGLLTTWSKQNANGAIFAGAGVKHWKDTAIAMFTLVRHCELTQDWALLDELTPNVLRGVSFLDSVREHALTDGSINGRYGLLAPGFGDGGLGGLDDTGLNATSNELANTLWTLAGLKSIMGAAKKRNRPALEPAAMLYTKLFKAIQLAAASQMRRHDPGQFDFLPMLLKEDPQWAQPDPWARPRNQTGQWALSHTIYPGLVFATDDPIVRGHAQLMMACAQEDVPAETGWARHQAVWAYNAPFVCQVYLWLGMREQAERTFRGFLNHATRLYCWREEQPLRTSAIGQYVGDMPHNWASAECIRYLRHSLVLEDGEDLRLLSGLTGNGLASRDGYTLKGTPTRFGRIDLQLEPRSARGGWHLSYKRTSGPTPERLTLPKRLGGFDLKQSIAVKPSIRNEDVEVRPDLESFTADWV